MWRMVLSLFLSLLPTFEIPVAAQAWVTGIIHTPPLAGHKKQLTHPDKEKWKTLSKQDAKFLADVSDTLLFDFLVDDHDRLESKNWLSMIDNRTLLLWDNGLGWNHGPYGISDDLVYPCLSILCGPQEWYPDTDLKDQYPKMMRAQRSINRTDTDLLPSCDTVCAFRDTTVDRLRRMNNPSYPEERMSNILRRSLQRDNLSADGGVFRFGVYFAHSRSTKYLIRYTEDDFFWGMDEKVRKIVNHVDRCISIYGAENVLLSEPRHLP